MTVFNRPVSGSEMRPIGVEWRQASLVSVEERVLEAERLGGVVGPLVR